MPNIHEFFHSTIGEETTSVATGLPEDIKCLFIGALDVRKEFDWNEIDGVRRVIEIRFYSDITNTNYNISVFVKRVFSYLPDYPRDLSSIQDSMVAL